MKRFIWTTSIAALLCIQSCSGFACDEAYYYSALEHTKEKFPQYGGLDVWLSGNYDPSYWENRFKVEQIEIDHYRAWAAKQEPCVKSAYYRWMDYYQRGLDEARKELKFKEIQTRQAEYEATVKKRYESKDQFERNNKIPHP